MGESIDKSSRTVVIVMSTYNGEKYLNQQLESLRQQTLMNVHVFVRDDGSEDTTQEILQKWSEDTEGWLTWYQGKNCGPGRSFMDALGKAPNADYYAFCDQDDIWDRDKLAISVEMLERSSKQYKIYTSNVLLVNNNMESLGKTNFQANTSIQRAMMYNQAVGCTIVMNKALKQKLTDYKPEYMVMHDCWSYRVCAALGGDLCFDHIPHMKYRQHDGNFSGGSMGKVELWKKRFKSLFGRKKHMRKWTAETLLRGYGQYIPENHRYIVEKFAYYDRSIKNKWLLLKEKEIYSDSFIGNLGIVVSIILGML